MGNAVNHPDKYILSNGQEVMDMIINLEEDPTDFIMGELLKHQIGWYNEYKKDKKSDKGPKKKDTEDLENCVWYLQYLIAYFKDEAQKELDAFIAAQQGGMTNG